MRFNVPITVLFVSTITGVAGLPLAESKPVSFASTPACIMYTDSLQQSSEMSKRAEEHKLEKRAPVKALLLLWAAVTLIGGSNQREWFSPLGWDWKPEDGVVVKREAPVEEAQDQNILPERWRQQMVENDKAILRAIMEADMENFSTE